MAWLPSSGGSGSGWHGRCGPSRCPRRCPSPGRSPRISSRSGASASGPASGAWGGWAGPPAAGGGIPGPGQGSSGCPPPAGRDVPGPPRPGSRDSWPGRAAVQEVQGLAGGDGDEPGAEAGFEAEAGQGPVDPEEGLLDHVVGVQVVLDDGEGLAVDVPLEALHQQAEGGLVAGLGRLHPGPDLRGVVGGIAQDRRHAGLISSLGYHGSCSMRRASRMHPLDLLQRVDPGGGAEVEWNLNGRPDDHLERQHRHLSVGRADPGADPGDGRRS